ncbi:phage portal protein [Rummeliibacillus suwonensis]|uniref:phage portal protein n=1 Tax=Rummeliibacillus suwonensis TaxID=1306154 RepID=UPI00289DC3C6|nr:phage portal protein [Rummeliibacillus suwonensis]
MELNEYINAKYDGESDWFVQVVNEPSNQMRVQDIHSKKEYLNGTHAILNSPAYKYNGKIYNPRKIVVSYAKTLLNFQKSFLLSKPVVYTGKERVVKAINEINRKGKMDRINVKILHNLLSYGEAYEYLYIQDGKIKSRIIDTEEGYPLYDHNNELMAFVQHYINDGISYYIVYTPDNVYEYSNEGGTLHLIGEYSNLSGLPVIYKTDNELSHTRGKSELDDWIFILDEIENVLSKFTDTVYKNMNPIPVVSGQELKGNGIATNIVGQGVQLDDGSEFKFASIQLDVEAFNALYDKLIQTLFDISSIPNVAMDKAEIANVSETSIRILYSLANVKAKINENYLRDGFEERLNKYRILLSYLDVNFTDDEFETLDIQFSYDVPSNDTEVINNLKTLYEMKSMSLESVLEKSPYINDSVQELERIHNQSVEQDLSTVDNHNSTVGNNE